MATRNQEIAAVIKQQIGVPTLMSVGAHDFSAVERGLRFKVGGRRQTWATVTLNGRDTYDIEVFHLDRSYNHVIDYSQTDVYAEDLARVVRDHADLPRGRHRRRGLARAAARR